jgi:membrane protease YdiL (CAAX protease family)
MLRSLRAPESDLASTASSKPVQTPLASSRLLSGAEFFVGAAIVIGHNVFRVVPNEVPILIVLAIVSMRLRNGGWAWSSFGFKRPDSWVRVVAFAAAAAALRIVLGEYVIDPLTAHFWPPAIDPNIANEVKGNLGVFLLYLPIIWGFAAFGEEIAYRGYLLNRAADSGGRSMLAFWIAVVVSSVLFGYGHYYKGPSGIVDSGVAGLILASAYVLSGRNLWVAILAHGFIDTFGLTLAWLGLDD